MNTVGSLALLFRTGLRSDFRDEYAQYAPEYPSFLKTSTTNMPEQSASIITGPNRLYEIDDGERVTYETLIMGPKVMGVDKEFALGIRITRKTAEDDQYGKVRAAAKYLAKATRLTFEVRAASFLDDAFTGNVYKGIDNVAWLSASHTFLNAPGTWSNTVANPVALSASGITAMQDLFMTLKDHNGDPIQSWPDKLIIGNNAQDWNMAHQILNSDKEPFTADNQDNALKKRFGGITVVISRYKSNPRSFFMVDSKYNDAHFVTRRAPSVKTWDDPETGAAHSKVDTRFLIWGVDPRGWVGANAS